MTKEEKYVRDELTKVYPQLKINMQKTCGFNAHRWADDLLAVSVTFFLEKDLDVQLKVISDGKLENYITFIAGMQVKSGSSKFFNTYRKFMNNQREILPNYLYKEYRVTYPEPFEDEENLREKCLRLEMDKLNPYERMIVEKKVIDDMTYKDISKTYNIPYSSLAKDAKAVMEKIKNACIHL